MENVIEFHNVSKKFASFEIDQLNLKVKKGYITGFIGTNGAGKSTIIKMIMNILQPDTGDVHVFGLQQPQAEKVIKSRLGFVYDQNIFYPWLNLQEIQKMIAPTYPTWDQATFLHYVEQFELPMKKAIKHFSKGMQTKASLAIALSHHAELLIMDEPTAGLDPAFRMELMAIFQQVMVEEGRSIFFSTHTTSDLERYADYIVVLDQGKILLHAPTDEILQNYVVVKGSNTLLDRDTKAHFIHIIQETHTFRALASCKREIADIFGEHVVMENISLDELIFYLKAAQRQ
ncbi:ABC transporter ATP-binding protein [Lysinibacillus alkalisoli]|uniref:ABC transporter ATP-binding protein n=1 Tax=Lysinibacillus alkalisoli TaxID=1911548 RepID=A0A917G9Q6_9BACI|nr:ABC transporter ATP-binding protein [Lysinibacillus alkalisoli]GGG31955.1 ABC transporter ATP-binding protein [Lysinibacillus alkalisoli]